jgi:hypothetical protein
MIREFTHFEDLDDSVTAEEYRNNILDVFHESTPTGSGVFLTRRGYGTGYSSLFEAIF